jgi:hypothetical protein
MCMTVLVAALAVAGVSAAGAEDATETEVEARDDGDAGDGFTPPLTGAPDKRMGAASRELGPARPDCEEQATDEEVDGDCVEGAANAPGVDDTAEGAPGETEGVSGQ